MNRHSFLAWAAAAVLLWGAPALFAEAEGGTAPAETRPATAETLVTAAREQVGVTTRYDAEYVVLEYPGGDVPVDRGVCTDVVIRAFRVCGIDLQEKVHLDMKDNFQAYPKRWGLRSTDKNIDHRRVPNLRTFFQRRGISRKASTDNADYQPGDLVTCTVGENLPHIMIVSDRKGPSGNWMILHNIGQGAREEDRLFEFPLTGHFRWKWGGSGLGP